MSARSNTSPLLNPVAFAYAVAFFISLSAIATAQENYSGNSEASGLDSDKFTFVRVQYDSVGGWGEAYYDYDYRRWQRWETDYPQADENFLVRLAELTTCQPNPKPIVRRLTDKDLFRFPFIYMVDVGWMKLSVKEKEILREYLLRGGFLWVDDFWGDAEWKNLEANLQDVISGYEWRPIPSDHPIMNVVFPLKECPRIPARDFAMQGWKWDPPDIHRRPAGGEAGVSQVHFRGVFDETDRLMVVATHNTDIGDGFEREGYDEEYFKAYSVGAYAIGINIVIYALTH